MVVISESVLEAIYGVAYLENLTKSKESWNFVSSIANYISAYFIREFANINDSSISGCFCSAIAILD